MLRRISLRLATAALGSAAVAPAAEATFQGLNVAVYMNKSLTANTDAPLAVGVVTSRISSDVYAVSFSDVALSPVIEVGSRVYVNQSTANGGGGGGPATGGPAAATAGGNSGNNGSNKVASLSPDAAASSSSSPASSSAAEAPVVVGGLVAKVNGNGTYGVLLDTDRFEPAVPRNLVSLSEGRSKILTNDKFNAVLQWVRNAGVDKRSDQESTACILFSRGWRAEKLYLLDNSDVGCLSHLNRSVRMSLLEKADWEREHQRQRRDISKERLKEKDFRYVLTKYSSVFSACVAVCMGISVFTWNLKNWRRGLRSTQVNIAAETLTQQAKRPKIDRNQISRVGEEDRLRMIMRRQDVSHPRIVVFTGSNGCGKSFLCRTAAYREKIPAVFVDIRSNEDPLRAIVKSLGVQNVEVCGDLLDFISEACDTARSLMNGVTPLIVIKLREGSLQRVYNECVSLACDRRLCHVMIETPIETLTLANTSLPRLDFYYVPNFSVQEAFQYTQHLVDPIDLMYFLDVVGTNSNDLDELIAGVTQRHTECLEYVNRKLVRAMRQVSAVMSKDVKLRDALLRVATFDFDSGLKDGGNDLALLGNPLLKDLVYYNAVQDAWMFQSKLLHSAVSAWK